MSTKGAKLRAWLLATVVVASVFASAATARAEQAVKTIVLDQISIETVTQPPRAFYVIQRRDSAPPALVLASTQATAQTDVIADYAEVAAAWEAAAARRRELEALVARGRAERARLEKNAAPGRAVPLVEERAGFVMALGSPEGLEPVRRELAGAWAALARCGAERPDPGQARGAVVFVVDGHGAVADARWIGDGAEFGACLAGRLRALRFRGPPAAGHATYLLAVPPDPEALAAARRALARDR